VGEKWESWRGRNTFMYSPVAPVMRPAGFNVSRDVILLRASVRHTLAIPYKKTKEKQKRKQKRKERVLYDILVGPNYLRLYFHTVIGFTVSRIGGGHQHDASKQLQ